MAESLGKKFEAVFKQDWKKCFPDSFIYRLPDQISGYKNTSSNPCDFICFAKGHLFLIECKEHKGASIPFQAMRQYDRMLPYKDVTGVHPGFVIWYSDKDTVIWCPIKEAEKMKIDGKKSVSIDFLKKMLYNVYEIPSVKKRVFMETDYTALVNKILEEESEH